MFQRKYIYIILLSIFCYGQLTAQQYTTLIKGGRVIDPKNNIDGIMDIAITGDTIAKVAKHIDQNLADKVILAEGLIITPGLIDLHSHNFFGTEPNHYLSNGLEALPPDGFTFRCGITAVVDAGGAGWKNFPVFKSQVIDNSKTRVYAFLNIVGEGMRGHPYEQNINDMDSKMTALVALQHKEVVGVKVAHYSGSEWTPVDRALDAAKRARIPVMIDFGGNIPPLSLADLLINRLRSGDIFTHAYANVSGRMPIVDANGEVMQFVKEAQEKGVIFDVGHGGGSFAYSQAVPATQNGFFPNTISTDLHTGSMNAGMKDLLNVMSKFLNLGMTLPEVINASSWKSAQVIQKKDIGHLSVGTVADIAVFKLEKGNFGFVDSSGYKMQGDKKLVCELTIRAGEIVYDLNGMSKQLWTME
ncbi:amidohydrolase/deacetylase family metallohydrolase [Chondrinema litorale]|uniref:amidohydrolase/deacetylase family metallohydrolase n=1 Tax=Chondrinema litorale TaxID=2994555 RepID=UPI002543A171|nr:amidohydrolase/deacetylase family metallohydrolase [Chondrinema litorale]UZR96637.1 amidohydrolase/deacetylase family metallohydrolase [Chondrinema litorale]